MTLHVVIDLATSSGSSHFKMKYTSSTPRSWKVADEPRGSGGVHCGSFETSMITAASIKRGGIVT
eukprot:7077715-Pyramimonas_sp.AAC.2